MHKTEVEYLILIIIPYSRIVEKSLCMRDEAENQCWILVIFWQSFQTGTVLSRKSLNQSDPPAFLRRCNCLTSFPPVNLPFFDLSINQSVQTVCLFREMPVCFFLSPISLFSLSIFYQNIAISAYKLINAGYAQS